MKVWIVNYGNILDRGTNPRLLSYYNYLEKQGHEPCFCFIKKGDVQPGYNVIQSSIAGLSRRVFKERPGLIYLYCPNILFFPIYLITRLLNIPIVIEKTEWDSIKPIENNKDYINKILYKLDEIVSPVFAHLLVVISHRLFDKYKADRDVLTLYHGPFLPYHAQADSKDQIAPMYTLGYMGTFGQKDDIDLIVQTFQELAISRPNISLKCIGKVSSAIRSNYNISGITFTGEVKAEDIVSELADCQILLALRNDGTYSHFGFPSKLTEYLATGRPVISSAVSDIPETFTHQEQMFIVKPGNQAELREAINYLLDHPEKAKTIGKNGQSWAMENWDTEAILEKWLNKIMEVTDSGPSPA